MRYRLLCVMRNIISITDITYKNENDIITIMTLINKHNLIIFKITSIKYYKQINIDSIIK
jgi:hypothetical protein